MQRVELRPGAIFLLSLLCFLDPLGCFVPFILAAGLHECGHWLALRACGTSVISLRVGATGAVMRSAALSRGETIFCAFAGPAVNLMLLLIFAQRFPNFAAINGLLAVYNLLPIAPLDGGTILQCLFPAHRCEWVGVAAMALCTIAALGASLLLHCGLWPLLLLGVLLVRTARENAVANPSRLP
jgi:membrane-associated protease RseP (regulator of RpoE activity)